MSVAEVVFVKLGKTPPIQYCVDQMHNKPFSHANRLFRFRYEHVGSVRMAICVQVLVFV